MEEGSYISQFVKDTTDLIQSNSLKLIQLTIYERKSFMNIIEQQCRKRLIIDF